jgi:hypothetical protein
MTRIARLRIVMKIEKITPAAILLLVFLVQPLCAEEPKETKRVLILYSEDKDHPAHELTDRGIRATFESNKRFHIRLYTEYLDAARFGSPAHTRAFAAYLRSKYTGLKIDIVIAVYPNAVNIILSETGGMFLRVPIVACEVSRPYADRLENSPKKSLLTGTVMGENISGMLHAALRMKPGLKRVALI